MFSFFRKKGNIEKIKREMQNSFDSVKSDFKKVGKWVEHLDDKTNLNSDIILEMKKEFDSMKESISEIKDFISFFGPQLSNRLSKQTPTVVHKQAAVQVVQTAVQTAVQTGILSNMTIMERAIIWALLNSEMKLSYEDIASLLGKTKSTIRGQINGLKQKSEGLVEEVREANGKKRLYIPEKMKDIIIKSVKVRVKEKKNKEKESDF